MYVTASNIAKLSPGNYKDKAQPGLWLVVGARTKTWWLRWRQEGKPQKERLGYFIPHTDNSMSLTDARDKARQMLLRIDAGLKVEAPAPVHPKVEKVVTVADVIDRYEAYRIEKAKGGEKKWLRGMRNLPDALRTVRRCLAPYLTMPAAEFSRADLRAARDEAAKSIRFPGKQSRQMSDRFLSYISPIWRYAAAEELVPFNFVPDTLRIGPGKVARDRTLTSDEALAIWHAAGAFNTPGGQSYGRLVRFLMIVPVRIEEACALTHGRIIDGYWRQSEADNKSGRQHLLKLPPLALSVLGEGTADELCFAGRKEGRSIRNHDKFKKQLDKMSGVTGWRTHDLRRTVATSLQNMTDAEELPLFSRDIINALLNHALTEGVDVHYLHASMDKAKAKALAVWEQELRKILKLPVLQQVK